MLISREDSSKRGTCLCSATTCPNLAKGHTRQRDRHPIYDTDSWPKEYKCTCRFPALVQISDLLRPSSKVEMRLLTFSALAELALLATVCTAIPYEEYILAPATRDLVPEKVYHVNGSVTKPNALTNAKGGKAIFNGVSSVTYDFGRNIAGIVSVDVGRVSSKDAFIGVTFTESSLWINSEACDATADAGLDSPLWFPVGHGPGRYTAEKKHNRGGFRYMTLVSNTSATVAVERVRVHFTAAPTQNLRAYTGYFHCNDELLNRIWYAGAYTNQLCTIDPSMGNALPWLGIITSNDNITLPETVAWWTNYTISNGSSVFTDGAKRDRLIWPGDMSIALESVAVSTYDLYSMRVALEALFSMQQPDGRLPYAGKPFFDVVSYTYHLHSLVGVSHLYRYSGDLNWLAAHWSQYKLALQWSLSSIDSTGLANVTASADWLRFGMGGHVRASPPVTSHFPLTTPEHRSKRNPPLRPAGIPHPRSRPKRHRLLLPLVPNRRNPQIRRQRPPLGPSRWPLPRQRNHNPPPAGRQRLGPKIQPHALSHPILHRFHRASSPLGQVRRPRPGSRRHHLPLHRRLRATRSLHG
jgi:hypothetical protein